jgi:hypothetical protein
LAHGLFTLIPDLPKTFAQIVVHVAIIISADGDAVLYLHPRFPKEILLSVKLYTPFFILGSLSLFFCDSIFLGLDS